MRREKETYEIPETAACIAYAEAKIPKEIRENGMVTLAGSRVKNGWLELKAIYWPKMGNRLVPVRNRGIAACAKVHLFCGKTEEEADEEEGEAKQMVWVTENGSVYHTDSSCSHINLSIQVSHRVRLRGNGIRMEKNIRNANSAWEMALRVRKFTIRNTETGIITVFPAKG